MKRGGDSPAPDKGPLNRQVERTFDPSESDSSLNIDPAALRIGAAQLFVQATEQTRMAICVSDPQQDDCPIVYANRAFVELTGYPLDEIVGHNCRFLQGKDTDPGAVERLRKIVRHRTFDVVDILNYRKDGTPFWNAVHIGPIYDEKGELAYFYGSQWDITELVREREKTVHQERIASELRHRTDNLFAVISAIVRISARNATDPQDLADKITSRVGALAAAHRVSIDISDGAKPDTEVEALVKEIVQPYRTNNSHRFDISGERVRLSRNMVTPLGLTLHELATNALKYGALSRVEGEVVIDWHAADGDLVLTWREQHGPEILIGAPAKSQGNGSGSRIMQGVLDGIGGTFETRPKPSGYEAIVTIPMQVEPDLAIEVNA